MPRKRKQAVPDSRRNGAVDEAGAETFPASDPPAYAGGAHSIGAPARPQPRSPKTESGHKPARMAAPRPAKMARK